MNLLAQEILTDPTMRSASALEKKSLDQKEFLPWDN
jgi:hypothetical protein